MGIVMLKFLTTDWVSYFFDKISLSLYEKEQQKYKKYRESEKQKIVKNNKIIVKVNDKIIYDSSQDIDMSDDLYYALLSYGLKESVKSQKK